MRFRGGFFGKAGQEHQKFIVILQNCCELFQKGCTCGPEICYNSMRVLCVQKTRMETAPLMGPLSQTGRICLKDEKRMDRSLILASSSPRRRELMGYTGIPFEVVTADAPEEKDGAPDALVMENAARKARAVWKAHPGRIVLGADTVVYQDGRVLGKPRDKAEAQWMLEGLSGSWHTVYTGVCVIGTDGKADVRVDTSRVLFVSLGGESIARYVETGEPMDKAGAYALQGIGGMFVRRIEGSYSNVIGLPMALVRDMLMDAGMTLI